MKIKGMKRRLVRTVSLTMVLVCSLCAFDGFGGGGVCLAIAPIPNGTVVVKSNTYRVDDVITNWNQLEGLLKDYNTINLTRARIRDNDFSHFVHLGEESDTKFIARIECSLPKELYPQMILPAFDTATRKFQAARPTNSITNPSIITLFGWTNTMSYVYDDTRDNNICVDHGVLDENGQVLLEYAGVVENIDEVDTANNTLTIKSINSPERSGERMKITYLNAYNGYTSQSGSLKTEFNYPISYYYDLFTEFNSTLKTDVDLVVLGGIKILAETESGELVQGAKYKIYNDSECTEPAERYNGDAWVEIDVLESGADGTAIASNLMPGTYYVKQVEAASGYEENAAVVELDVAGKEIDLGVNPASGEGESIEIYKEDVFLEPVCDVDSFKVDAGFKDNPDNVETVSAASYNDGGEIFIRAGGAAALYENAEDVGELEGMSKLNGEKYQVEVGGICESFDNPSDAMEYVNTELIANGGLDNARAQDHVTIKGDNLMYYDEESCVQASFTESELVDIPPTGVRESLFAIPLIVVALIGCLCLVLI